MSRLSISRLTFSSALIALSLGATALVQAEPITLDVIAWKGNEAEPAGLPELIERFEAANPDVDVELTFVARKDIDKVMPPRLQSGTPPDVTMVDPSLVQLWGDAGFLQDLGADTEWVSRLAPSVRDVFERDGKMFVMPLETIGMGNFINMGLLNSVGIDEPPVTIEAIKAACSALADNNISPMILAGGFPAMLWVGGAGLSAEGVTAAPYGDGSIAFTGDANFEASLSSVRELVDAKCFDPKLQAGLDPWSTALEEFKAGRVAMMPHGAWNIGNFSKIDGLDFVFAPMPSVSGDVGVALDLIGPGWAIPRDAKHADAAQKWVEFFTHDENLSVFSKAEAAYSTFAGAAGGMPDLAAPYTAARDAGSVVLWPFSTLAWPKALQTTWEESLTGFLLNLENPNSVTLERWDETIEDNL